MPDAATIARACALAAADKKAENLVALDMREVSTFTDFFVIGSAGSEPQLKAIATSIREHLREEHGLRPLAEDGFPASQWVVLDYGDVIVHLFRAETRERYGLEKLWRDAPHLDLGPLGKPAN
jgi:ribosome-associated protein